MRFWGWWRDHADYVNVHDTTTRARIWEAEIAEESQRHSQILRISGQQRNRPTHRRSAIVERAKQ